MTQRKDAVTRFLEFLRFPTVSGEGPNGVYAEVWGSLWRHIPERENETDVLHVQLLPQCAQWLRAYLEEIGLSVRVFSIVENKPIVLVRSCRMLRVRDR
jgi:hypothetical protein